METLEAYFKYNGNIIKLVAQQLYIHYNTAIYRMEQIQKLLKLDFNNPDDRLNIEMALKLKNFISAKKSPNFFGDFFVIS
ncbi:MAG: PucR family transcriptional regulator, purine catabolism regulatory protein [Eubacteriaceae bacterium]|nr:PucR family transcriptional regulator, purine catabolism regulatory protein [Eubacteriaceae bacterium]